MKKEQYLIHENEKFVLYIGHPNVSSSTRIDVTMAVKIGMLIGEFSQGNKKRVGEVELIKIEKI